MTDQPLPSPRAGVSPRLIALNAALLGTLAVLPIAGAYVPAAAQPGVNRGRGEYTMVSARYQGGTANGVFILDAANQEVLGLSWNRNRNEFEPIGLRSLLSDGQRQAPPR